MNASKKTFTTIVLLALAFGGGFLLFRFMLPGPQIQHALQLPEPTPIADVQLIDADGESFGRERFLGHWTLVFFGFTHCPDICPATLQLLSVARQQLAESATVDELPDILLISVDPERDTPESLKLYASHFGDGVYGATGTIENLRAIADSLGIYFAKQESTDDNYTVAHSAHVLLFDDQGKFNAVFSAPHSVDAFVSDLPILMAQ